MTTLKPEVVPNSGSGNAFENEPLTNVPVSLRQIREADGGGLLNPPALFALADFHAFFSDLL
jgi:hypothetical protein